MIHFACLDNMYVRERTIIGIVHTIVQNRIASNFLIKTHTIVHNYSER